MAKVWVSLAGTAPREVEADSIRGVKTTLGGQLTNHFAMVNKEPADDNTLLSDGDFVALAAPVKGG